MEKKHSFKQKLKHLVIGKAHSIHDKTLFHRLSLIAFFAWVGLGADALSSSSYGPEEAFLALHGHVYLGLFVALASAITIFVISASYSQIIELFPGGGGGYLVASRLLSPVAGMVSGCALIIDYVLTITISIAAGAAAIFSFLPQEFQPLRIWLALFGVALLIILNLRGIKESVVPLVPIFLLFVITHIFIIGYVLIFNSATLSNVASSTIVDTKSTFLEIGFFGVIALMMHAYSMGAGTFTGIEAVSNGLQILRKPRVRTAKKTMRYMAISLSVMVLGLMIAYLVYNVSPQAGKTLNAVLFENITKDWKHFGYTFVLLILFSEAALLFIAAQTGFFDGPRVLANMALDGWLPKRFASLSDRFIMRNGVLIIGGFAIFMMLLTKGSVKFLVVLYSINVFITFVLSQLGMVKYWWSSRHKLKHWKYSIFVNGLGLLLCSFILISVVILKFNEGGWITLIVTGALIFSVVMVKRHYNSTSKMIGSLDYDVLSGTKRLDYELPPSKINIAKSVSEGKTAVVLVKGFNGLGIHTIKNILENFKGNFSNFVFVEVGSIDAGNFKGVREIENIKSSTRREVHQYVELMKSKGYYAESYSAIGIDVVEEISRIAPRITKKFPDSVFFGSQVIFPKDTFFTRLLHNYTLFSIQRRLYNNGITVVVLPVRI